MMFNNNIDNLSVTDKPLNSYSPKKMAGNLSASSRSSNSSHDENGKVKLREHFRNVIIQEEQDDTESVKNSKRETNTESQSRLIQALNLYNIAALGKFVMKGSSSLRSRMQSDSSELTGYAFITK